MEQKKNSNFRIMVFFFGYFALMAGSLPAVAATLAVDGKAAASIIVSDSATVPEQTAARELADYLGKVTGGTFVITTEDQVPKLKTYIYVGHTAYTKNQGIDPGTLKPEQWIIRTVGKNLLLAGGRPRGTLYAVYHFLEDIVGVHWWSPWEEYVPSRENLSIDALDRKGEPVFWVRGVDTLWFSSNDTRFAARNRINREPYAEIPFEYGGENEFGPPRSHHTEHDYSQALIRSQSFEKHPEWFATINGQRQIFPEPNKNHLCLSNPELRLEYLRLLEENIRKTRNQPYPPMIFDVSLNDSPSICECASCQAVVKKYGGFNSGLLLEFVNYMADGIKEQYPGVLIETLAYSGTTDAPTGIVPRANVAITLCDTDSGVTEPIPENGYFAKRLQAWSKITDRLFTWDYHTNFGDPVLPMPYEYTFQPDLKLFRKYNVKGVYTQFHDPVFEDMRDLRLWLLAKLYEDPYQDQDVLIKTFTNGFYGPAGPYIREYIVQLGKAALADPGDVHVFGKTRDCPYLTPSFVLKMQETFDKAEKAISDSDVLLRRVDHARLAIDKAALALFPNIWSQWYSDGKEAEDLPLNRDQIAFRIKNTVETQYELRGENLHLPQNKVLFLGKIDEYLKRKLVIIPDPTKSIRSYTEADVSKTYCLIDVSAGPQAERYPVTYTDTQPDLKEGIYKSSIIVLRKIPAGEFMMGSPDKEKGRDNDGEGYPGAPAGQTNYQHKVIISRDFFIGVFEITQEQYKNVTGETPSKCYVRDIEIKEAHGIVVSKDYRPVETISYEMIREIPGWEYVWPGNKYTVYANSFMGLLQSKTGLRTDLPTEAQWEYACRAGTTGALNNGKKDLDTIEKDADLDELGWYHGNNPFYPQGSTHPVGEKKPNAWGLYDMHGNVDEFCLDWFQPGYPNNDETDPVGAEAGIFRIIRGGNYQGIARGVRSASRDCRSESFAHFAFGFRLCVH